MTKQFWSIIIVILLLSLVLCGCGTASETVDSEVSTPVKTPEPEIEPDPQWLSEAAIDEAYNCLFPLEGEKNVELAQDILLPLVESGNAEAQYYWGYIYDWEIVDNNGDGEKESLYWYNLAVEQDFPKAYLAAALNTYVESEERANELVELAKQAGLFEMTSEELGADGCEFIGSYYAYKKDYRSSLEWNLKAAELGSAVAMDNIGLMYYGGAGVKKDIHSSLDWHLKAANLGNVYAMYHYASLLFKDEVATALINYEYASALDGYQKAADAGDSAAMYNIGIMHEMGYGGLNKNAATALTWYRKAAEANHTDAMYKMGSIYEEGYLVAKDYEIAMEWYQKAADAGSATAMYKIGSIYEDDQLVEANYEMAIEWYRKAADVGNVDAMERIGYIYEYVEQDEATAYQWYTRAAYVKDEKEYYSDKGKVLNTAMEWYQKAADAGYAIAMDRFGYYSLYGRDVFFDTYQEYCVYPELAMEWYQKSADEGSATAMYSLGYMYAEGVYVRQDFNIAMEWFIKAYVNGDEDAAEWINYMLSNKLGVNAYFEHYGELIAPKP